MSAEGYEDYVNDGTAAVVDLSQLHELAEKQIAAEAEVARAEAELQKAKDVLKDLCEFKVPELMDSIGLEEFKTRTGVRIKVEEKIRASIPKARTLEAFAWLRENNHAALIKRFVKVEFGKGEDEKADELLKELAKLGFSGEQDASVHAQTLAAFVRERLKDGKELPLDLFGVYRQRVSKVET